MRVSELLPHQESARRLMESSSIPLELLAEWWNCRKAEEMEVIAAATGFVQFVEERENSFFNRNEEDAAAEITTFVVSRLPGLLLGLLNYSSFEDE